MLTDVASLAAKAAWPIVRNASGVWPKSLQCLWSDHGSD